MIRYSVGLSLSPASPIESGAAVMELETGRLVYMDKLFSMNDIQMFFDNYTPLKSSVVCVSLPWDNTMLEGKWRVLSKQYQQMNIGRCTFLNRDNWMQRFSSRGSELFLNLKNAGVDISRFEVYLARQKLNLYSNFKERSSADCKFFQSALKFEYGFWEMPVNMLPVAQLEAITGAILGREKCRGNTSEIFKFHNLSVINRKGEVKPNSRECRADR